MERHKTNCCPYIQVEKTTTQPTAKKIQINIKNQNDHSDEYLHSTNSCVESIPDSLVDVLSSRESSNSSTNELLLQLIKQNKLLEEKIRQIEEEKSIVTITNTNKRLTIHMISI